MLQSVSILLWYNAYSQETKKTIADKQNYCLACAFAQVHFCAIIKPMNFCSASFQLQKQDKVDNEDNCEQYSTSRIYSAIL